MLLTAAMLWSPLDEGRITQASGAWKRLIPPMSWSPLDKGAVPQQSSEWTRDWAAVFPGLKRQTARLRLESSGAPTLNFHEKTLWWTDSKPRSVARLSKCVAVKNMVTCSASVSVVGTQFLAAPARLELDLEHGTGAFLVSPPSEPAVPVALYGTPLSLNSSLTWISTDTKSSAHTKPTVVAIADEASQLLLEESSQWRLRVVIRLDNDVMRSTGNFEFRALRCSGSLTVYGMQPSSDELVLVERMEAGNCVRGCKLILESGKRSYREECGGRVTGRGEFR